MLYEVPAPRSMSTTSTSRARTWFITRTFCRCLMLAAESRSAGPADEAQPRRGVSVRTSSIDDTRRWMKSPSVRCGVGSPRQVCRFAPPRSASTRTTRRPMRASCQPTEAASSDLPIPPLPPPIDQIWRRVPGAATGRTSDTLRAISEPYALHDRSKQIACRFRLLPDGQRGVGDHANRLPPPDHGQVPLPPVAMPLDRLVVVDHEGRVERPPLARPPRRRSRTRSPPAGMCPWPPASRTSMHSTWRLSRPSSPSRRRTRTMRPSPRASVTSGWPVLDSTSHPAGRAQAERPRRVPVLRGRLGGAAGLLLARASRSRQEQKAGEADRRQVLHSDLGRLGYCS